MPERRRAVSGTESSSIRTGTRCTTLWALTQAGEQDNASILATAEQAGYDLSQLAGRLDQRRGQ